MLILENALQKFGLLDPEVVFIVNSDRFTGKIMELSKKYSVDLNAAVLHCVVGDLKPEELADYLIQEKEINAATAKAVVDELKNQVLKPLETRLSFLNADPDKKGITAAQEKDILRKIFSEGILAEMSEHFIIKNAFNLRIFDLLEKDLNFKRELERLLYENKELLTTNSLTVSGKPAEPTIGNWLKDFIDKKGTGDFNTIALSDYMTNSANTKNLTQDEKRKLFDLFNLYRNIKFFPDTVSGKPMEEWQIIPFDLAEVKNFIDEDNKKFQATKGEEEEAEELTAEQKLAKYDWSKIVGIERRALLEELGVSLKDFIKWSGDLQK